MPRKIAARRKSAPTGSQTMLTFYIAVFILLAVSFGVFTASQITGFQIICVNQPINSLGATGATTSSITLMWTTPEAGQLCSGESIVQYDLKRAASQTTLQGWGSGTTTISAPTPCGTDCQDSATASSLSRGTTYYFGIKYKVSSGTWTAISNIVSRTTLDNPGAPQSLTATASAGQITLTWSAPTSTGGTPITGYKIFRATTSGGQGTTPLATVSGTTLTHADNAVSAETAYYYKVKAVNSVGDSPLSSEASATTPPTITVPGAPILLSATAGDKNATLEWSAPTDTGGATITDYKIHRGMISGVYTAVIPIADETATSYVDTNSPTGLTNDQTYYYKISAVNSAGEGTKSNEMSATPFAAAQAATKCSDGTDYAQCAATKPKYCDDGNLVDKASLCGCPTGQTVSGETCIAPTTTVTPTDTTVTDVTPTETTTVQPAEDFDVLEGKARSAIVVAESAIRIAKEDKKNVTDAVALYNSAVSAYNSEDYQISLDKAKAATDAAQTAKLIEQQPVAELPVTAIIALVVVIAIGGAIAYYYKNIYKKKAAVAPAPQQPPAPQAPPAPAPSQRARVR